MAAVILILSAILIWNGCNPPKPEHVTVTTIDTEWIYSTDTQWLPAPVVAKETAKAAPAKLQPSANCDSLKGQYNYLSQNYFLQRVYLDTLTKDSIRLILGDTVENNRITGRMAMWDIKYPQVNKTETTTTTTPPRGQLYLGAGAGLILPVDSPAIMGNVSLLYKSKKDRITSVTYGMDTRNNKYVEVRKYFKISFRNSNR